MCSVYVRSVSLDEMQNHDEMKWCYEFNTTTKITRGPGTEAHDLKLEPDSA
jgi:hypothetical protein